MFTLSFTAEMLQPLAGLRPLYLAIWLALGGLSVVSLLLLRSRWGRSHPLHRCAVLSLLVHVVLACLAMTVRLVVGDDGAGSGRPIQVRLVDDPLVEVPLELLPRSPADSLAEQAAEAIAAADRPATDPAPPAPPEAAGTIADSSASEPRDAAGPEAGDEEGADRRDVAKDASDATAAEPTEAAGTAESPAIADAQTAAKAEPPAAGPAVEAEVSEVVTESAPSADRPTEPATELAAVSAASPYARRWPSARLRWAEKQGGGRETEAAVQAALRWLAHAQSSEGRWDARRYGAGQEMRVLGQDRGGAGSDADVGISALALLAFLGAGNTHEQGEYHSSVGDGLRFLIHGQADDGNLAPGAGLYAQMYCHSMATFALAEALAMTGDRRLEPVVRSAVDYSLRAQHANTGGWRYRVGDTGDTSQLGWQLMSLWSAEQAGLELPARTWTGAERFLRHVRRGQHGGLASYRPDGPPSTSMTAEACYCRQLVRAVIDGAGNRRAEDEASSHLVAHLPESSRINLYYWYYATLALHHRQLASDDAQRTWRLWNSALTTVLLDSQMADGSEAGSWAPNTTWGGYGGRVYTTAVAALCLETYYRYAPTEPADRWMAGRQEPRRLPAR